MALTILPTAGDPVTAFPPDTLPDAPLSPELSENLVSTVASTGMPMTEEEALAAPLPPQEPAITVGAPAPAVPPEIPDPSLTRAGIPRPTANPLAEVFGEIRWDTVVPRTMEERDHEWKRQLEIDKALTTPEMKETFRIVLDETSPLMAGHRNSFEDPEMENTRRIVDKFLRDYTGGEVPLGVNDIRRKMLIQEAAYKFFGGRGRESDVALKGEIANAAEAYKERSAAEYKRKFSIISPKLSQQLGTGVHAQMISGNDPGVVKKVKGGLNDLGSGDLSERVSQALQMADGDLDTAIRQQTEDAAAHRELLKPKGFLGTMFGGFGGTNPYADSSTWNTQLADEAEKTAEILKGIKAEFDSLEIPPEHRADYIRDTVKATAWTENSEDNIRLGSDLRIHINPGRVFGERAALVAEIHASAASPDEKHAAIKRLDSMRADMADKMDEILRRTDATGGDEWKKDVAAAWPPARVVYGSPGTDSYIRFVRDGHFANKVEALDAYTKSQHDRNYLFKFEDAITVGIQTGILGIAKTVAGTAGGLSGVAGMMGSDTAKEWAAGLGETQMAIGDLISDLDKASGLRGNTGELAVAKDLSSTVTEIVPMVAGGQYAAGLGRLSGAVVRGLSLYGTTAAQGYESITGSALEHAREKKGAALSAGEISAVLTDPKTQTGAFLNAIQTAALTKLMPGGTERAALGRLEGTTIRDFLARGGAGLLKDPAFRKEMGQLGRNIFADATDEMMEEFLNTATESVIRAGTLGLDLKLGDLLQEAAYSSLLAGPVGGGLPQALHSRRFYERIPGVPTTIGGSPPSPPGNPFRNPDGTLPIKLYTGSAADADLAEKEAKFHAILNRPVNEVDAAYDAIPDTHGGKIISTDLPRELLPEYDTPDGHTRYTGITGGGGRSYGRDRLWREIHNRGGRKSLLFTAGGPGSGKSTVVTKDLINRNDLIYDGTLRDQEWAVQNIEEASKQGWRTTVVSVTRPLRFVAVGVVERAIGEGRTFALADLPDAHYSAQRSAISIAKHFDGDAKVKVEFYYNGGSTRETPPDRVTLEKVDTGGEYSYDTQHGKDRGGIGGRMVGGSPERDSRSNHERFRAATRQDIIGVFRDAIAGKITHDGKPASHEVLTGLAGKDVELQRILKESGK